MDAKWTPKRGEGWFGLQTDSGETSARDRDHGTVCAGWVRTAVLISAGLPQRLLNPPRLGLLGPAPVGAHPQVGFLDQVTGQPSPALLPPEPPHYNRGRFEPDEDIRKMAKLEANETYGRASVNGSATQVQSVVALLI